MSLPPSSTADTPRLELRSVSKRYGEVVANDRVDLSVAAGEIHAILGENGAGKTTLMKIIYGAVRPDSGELRWNGSRANVASPRAARALGVAMVFQHFSLFETLSVAENVWLGLDAGWTLAEVSTRLAKMSDEYGLETEPERLVSSLSVGERQRVEIARALLTRPQLLILDEPTSVLTPQAVERLFEMLRRLSEQGCSILYISHKLDEVRALCHRCTVLRGGRVTGEVVPSDKSNAALSRLMMGADLPALNRTEPNIGAVALQVRGLSIEKRNPFGVALRDIEVSVREGEIVGVAGVSGNGQAELLACLSGEDSALPAGSVFVLGKDVSRLSARQRREHGLHFVPEERLGRGAVPSLSLARNTLLTRSAPTGPGGFLRVGVARDLALHLIARFNVKADGADAPASSLSGGNLQKFIVGREIDAQPKVLIIAQPTWGVDVNAASQIRRELLALRDAGCAILLISEELAELFELSTRLAVMARGRLSPVVEVGDSSVAQVGEWMSGLWNERSVEHHVPV